MSARTLLGLEGNLEAEEENMASSTLYLEYQEGLQLSPALAELMRPEIKRYGQVVRPEHTTLWLEYLAMIGIFAPDYILRVLDNGKERFASKHPGLFYIVTASLVSIHHRRYGDDEPEACNA